MTDEELIARLREIGKFSFGWTADQAADRIEALVNERDKYRDAFNTNCLVLRGTEERVERLEAALRLLHDNVVLAFPTLADLGPVANARAALATEADHD